MAALHSVLDNESYRNLQKIGTAGAGTAAIVDVFRATTGEPDQEIYVLVKLVSRDRGSLFFQFQRDAQDTSSPGSHINLLGVRNSFLTNNDTQFCTVFEYPTMGSIRSIMRRNFQNGLPEECIWIILREVMNGLALIHRVGQRHNQITAGHIFLSNNNVKLAHCATLYDEDEEGASTSTAPPETTAFVWASAPESFHAALPQYSVKADIWMLGILSLELAYGGLRFVDRNQLEGRIKKIKRFLRWGQLPRRADNSKLSKTFGKLVASCLRTNPLDRADLQQLRENKMFSRINDVAYLVATLAV